MKRKSIKILTTTLLLSTMLSFSSLASWEQVDGAWKYKDDSSQQYVTSKWIESTAEQGLWYYIDQTGVMAIDTLIDNQYYVNELGEWRENTGGSSSVNPGNQVNTDNSTSGGSLFDRAKEAGKNQLGDNPVYTDPEWGQQFNEGIIRN